VVAVTLRAELYCWSTARLSHLTCLLLGPYVFGVGLVSFLLSKEYWVFEHQLTQFISFWLVVYTIVRFYGAKIKKFLDNYDEACTVRQLMWQSVVQQLGLYWIYFSNPAGAGFGMTYPAGAGFSN